MTIDRAELERVRAALNRIGEYVEGIHTMLPTSLHKAGAMHECKLAAEQLALLDAALVKPEDRDWGIQFNDGQGTLVDSEIYPMTESEVKRIAAGDSRRKVFTRTKPYQVPAGSVGACQVTPEQLLFEQIEAARATVREIESRRSQSDRERPSFRTKLLESLESQLHACSGCAAELNR